jgi:hypothetical protein
VPFWLLLFFHHRFASVPVAAAYLFLVRRHSRPAVDTAQQRAIARRIVRAVAQSVTAEGYRLTRPTFLTQAEAHVIPFFHFHKFSGNPRFRLHASIRVLNDDFPAAALNGLSVERAGRFDASDESIASCVNDLSALLLSDGISFHRRWSDPAQLLHAPDDVLSHSAREWLRRALEGDIVPKHYALSRKLLGVSGRVV